MSPPPTEAARVAAAGGLAGSQSRGVHTSPQDTPLNTYSQDTPTTLHALDTPTTLQAPDTSALLQATPQALDTPADPPLSAATDVDGDVSLVQSPAGTKLGQHDGVRRPTVVSEGIGLEPSPEPPLRDRGDGDAFKARRELALTLADRCYRVGDLLSRAGAGKLYSACLLHILECLRVC